MHNIKLFVSGWYGNKNIGDELLSIAVANLLNFNIKNSFTYVASYNPKYTNKLLAANRCENALSVYRFPLSIKGLIKSIPNYRFYTTLFYFIKSDAFILGGGGFLSDWAGNDISGWLSLIKLAKKFKKKTIVFFVGAGPFINQNTKSNVAYTLNNYSDIIIVRDEHSKNALAGCGVIADKIIVSVDPVFYMTPQNINIDNTKNNPLELGINLISFFENNNEKHQQYLTSIYTSIQMLSKYGKVHFFAMHKSDRKFMQNAIQNSEVFCSDDPVEVLNEMNKMDILIGERFHFLICGLLLEKPAIPIVYNHKSYSLCERYQYTEYSVNLGDGSQWRDHIFTPDELEACVKKILADFDLVKRNIVANNKEMRNRIERTMQYIQDVLQ